jgi:hypothetical protein
VTTEVRYVSIILHCHRRRTLGLFSDLWESGVVDDCASGISAAPTQSMGRAGQGSGKRAGSGPWERAKGRESGPE